LEFPFLPEAAMLLLPPFPPVALEMRENQSQLQSFQSPSCDEEIAAKLMQKEVGGSLCFFLLPCLDLMFCMIVQINRLREEGFKKMKEQEEWLRQQVQEQS
jgi:hypothetical protein